MTYYFSRILFLFFLFKVSSCRDLPGKSSGDGKYQSRISGGRLASIRDHKHHVELRPVVNCGGTIIGTRYILSAWACNHDSLTIIAGVDHIQEGATKNYSVDRVQQSFLRQGRPSSESFQTMLVILKEDLIFGDTIFSVAIDVRRNVIKDGLMGTITGFGSTDQHSNYSRSEYLRAVDMPIFTHDTCEAKYSSYGREFKETKDRLMELCGGYDWSNISNIGGHNSFCHGDIGSGFIVNGFLVGVAVRNLGCGRGQLPGILESMWYIKNWIFDQVYHNHCVRYSTSYNDRGGSPCKYRVFSNTWS